jgi:hypothetical protein
MAELLLTFQMSPISNLLGHTDLTYSYVSTVHLTQILCDINILDLTIWFR